MGVDFFKPFCNLVFIMSERKHADLLLYVVSVLSIAVSLLTLFTHLNNIESKPHTPYIAGTVLVFGVSILFYHKVRDNFVAKGGVSVFSILIIVLIWSPYLGLAKTEPAFGTFISNLDAKEIVNKINKKEDLQNQFNLLLRQRGREDLISAINGKVAPNTQVIRKYPFLKKSKPIPIAIYLDDLASRRSNDSIVILNNIPDHPTFIIDKIEVIHYGEN